MQEKIAEIPVGVDPRTVAVDGCGPPRLRRQSGFR